MSDRIRAYVVLLCWCGVLATTLARGRGWRDVLIATGFLLVYAALTWPALRGRR